MKLTAKQAAERAGVSAGLVYRWCQEGVLAHYRLGGSGRRGKILIAPTDLDTLLASFRVEGRVELSHSVPTSDRASSGSPAAPFSEFDPARLARAWKPR